MDLLVEIVKAASIPGAAIVIVVVVIRPLMPLLVDWIKAKRPGEILSTSDVDENGMRIDIPYLNKKLNLIATNHLHEVKDLLIEIRDAQKVGNDRLLVILTKINGYKNF